MAEHEWTEERLAEYDRIAIDQDDVLVMGFVSIVRDLRAKLAEERERTTRIRVAIDAALHVVSPVTHETTYRLLLDAIAVIDRDGGQAYEARSRTNVRTCPYCDHREDTCSIVSTTKAP